MLLTKVSWANRVWALPFLTALAPSERYYEAKLRAHKPLTDWARQLLLQVSRWLGSQQLIAVGNSSYAVIDLLGAVVGQVSLISRLRLDAALYEPAPPAPAGQLGRKRLKGQRLPTLAKLAADATTDWQTLMVADWYGGQSKTVEYCSGTALWYHTGKAPVAIRWVLVRLEGKLTGLVSNDPTLTGEAIIGYFVRRWSIETTFGLVGAHLGVETQRQWSDKAISRTTPVLLGLFSLVALLADGLQRQDQLVVQQSSWYRKPELTFSDALGSVRQWLWGEPNFGTSGLAAGYVKMSQYQFHLWQQALAWAA